jgi:hypothetical protein
MGLVVSLFVPYCGIRGSHSDVSELPLALAVAGCQRLVVITVLSIPG